jgi:hypothetical protein
VTPTDLALRRLAPLIGRKKLRRAELERQLLLLTELPGLRLRSTQARGQRKDGGVKLVLEGEHNLVGGGMGLDNRSPPAMQGVTYNYALALNAPFGWGEQFYLSAATGYDLAHLASGVSPLLMVGGGVSMPIGDDGLALNPEYTHSATRPRPAHGAPATLGMLDRVELRIIYPLLKTRTHVFVAQASGQFLSQRLCAFAFGTDLCRDLYYSGAIQTGPGGFSRRMARPAICCSTPMTLPFLPPPTRDRRVSPPPPAARTSMSRPWPMRSPPPISRFPPASAAARPAISHWPAPSVGAPTPASP